MAHQSQNIIHDFNIQLRIGIYVHKDLDAIDEFWISLTAVN